MRMQTTRDSITNDFSVELNMTGNNLDPDKVTEIVGLAPVKAARNGEPRRPGTTETHEQGFWCYETSSQDEVNECRDHQLKCLVESVEPHVERLRDAGVERIYFYYTLSSFIGLLNVRFQSETLEKLGRIGADLYVSGFDCFNPKHSIWKEDGAVASIPADGQA